MWIPPFAYFDVDSPLTSVASLNAHDGHGGGRGRGRGGGGGDGDGDDGSQLRQWSSIIGIVTAIVGNILISVALNTQRYAHIRIEREHNEILQLSAKAAKTASARRRKYGTLTQEDI